LLARGGVLEAAGAASIKFREKDIVATAHRLDHVLVSLDAQLAAVSTSAEDKVGVQKQIKVREKMLLGVYQQVAVHFADLHDTPGRMKAKGVIRRQVRWAESRAFFYWRLKRRLLEFEYADAVGASSRKDAASELQAWFAQSGGELSVLEDDKLTVQWMEQKRDGIHGHIAEVKAAATAESLSAALASAVESPAVVEAFRSALAKLPKSDREKFAALLK
jgi:acetyl-CoA carboxylase/biotin carboxylase 1